ncbi:WD40-repeat-containing domain protein [Lipomyces oligophaga]|uniref:WD40-repeat-containing domain protein n=1 Tax=Lipomyces oligophaga TaxID=45792 RepID=UPI0034CEC320
MANSLSKRNSFSILTQQSSGLRTGAPISASAISPPSSFSNNVATSMMASSRSSVYHHRAAYYESPWPLFAADWSRSPNQRDQGRIAVATCAEDSKNRIQIIEANTTTEIHSSGQQIPSIGLSLATEASHSYPCTKLLWDPLARSSSSIQRLASAGDFLRIWEFNPETAALRQSLLLANKTKSEHTAPLTSLDWNTTDNSLIITSSIDTTCTIWDLNTSLAKTQLIAHDKEVFDARFTVGSVDVFASVGADGSVRVFDLRSLEHSTIIYEPANPPPLLRIATNHRDQNILATFAVDSPVVHVLDIRSPGTPVVELDAHSGPVNAVEWSPQKRNILASAGDDCQILIWDVAASPMASTSSLLSTSRGDIALAYTETSEVNNITWNASGDWVCSVAGRGVQAIRL